MVNKSVIGGRRRPGIVSGRRGSIGRSSTFILRRAERGRRADQMLPSKDVSIDVSVNIQTQTGSAAGRFKARLLTVSVTLS
ncbi:hypothetical protein OJAV_G00083840 [Oryzias javanicus]|uniref:Uncharacterized protein n=1 Tax=Oryzias javanicus TaxID=123683 RepID=A0A437D4Q3_ORYJA|nr:hypothetical protein OJAV_G00083840 [Oryzias javanicus]